MQQNRSVSAADLLPVPNNVPGPSLAIQEAIAAFLQAIRRPCRLLVAVSGGSDSIGLLVALREQAPADVTIVAATVDHRLRDGSAREAADVAALCAHLDVRHVTLIWDGEKPGTGISAAAREARYALLCAAADGVGADAILTGHTLDDQLETVAMRSLRGTEVHASGLSGMADAVLLHRRHWLFRPLLRTHREDIRDFLRGRGHGWIDDPSNTDFRYERARMRMAPRSQPPITVADLDDASARRKQISEAAASLLADHANVQHGVLMQLSLQALAADPVVLRYALSASAAVFGGREQGPGSDAMERVLKLVAQGTPGRLTAGRTIFDLRRSGLFLCRETRDLPKLTVEPGVTSIWDGRFRMTNASGMAVSVGSLEVDRQHAQEFFPSAPSSIAIRAARARPDVHAEFGGGNTAAMIPMLAPFDRFLPLFDRKIASALAVLVGCDNFPPLPLVDCERKR